MRVKLQRWWLKRIEKTLATTAQGKDTILFLARLLIHALLRSGYAIKGCPGGAKMYFNVWVFTDSKGVDEIRVDSITHGWEVRGPLHETPGNQ